MNTFISKFLGYKDEAREAIKNKNQSMMVGADTFIAATKSLRDAIAGIEVTVDNSDIELNAEFYPEIRIDPEFKVTADISDATIDANVTVDLDVSMLIDAIDNHAEEGRKQPHAVVVELQEIRVQFMKLVNVLHQGHGEWLDDFDSPEVPTATNGDIRSSDEDILQHAVDEAQKAWKNAEAKVEDE